MRVLVDTNILLRIAEPTHPQSGIALRATTALIRRDDEPCIVPQCLYEFWVVSTRPLDQNGLGFTTGSAQNELRKIEAIFPLLNDGESLLARWKQLVIQYDVKGKAAHDARLVAAMSVHGLTMLLTFNKPDFTRYPDITLLTPDSLQSPV